MRELAEDLGHLVSSLAAADVDHDLRVRPLGQLLLGDRLAGPKGSGNTGGAALG